MNKIERNWAGSIINQEHKNIIKNVSLEYLTRISKLENISCNDDISLASGISGIIIVLNEITRVLDIDTSKLIHEYVKMSEKNLHQHLGDISLYNGITGFNYAISLVNDTSGNYEKLLMRLDENLINNLTILLDQLLNSFNNKFNPRYDFEFDLISGLTGVTRYLLYRRNKSKGEFIENILNKCAYYFTRLCTDKILDDFKVKGWVTKKIVFDNKDNIVYTNVNEYNLGIAHGIPGILSILSLLYINNIRVPGQKDTIENIENWILDLNNHVDNGIWPCYATELGNNNVELSTAKRVAWCYGNPGIACSLLFSSTVSYNDYTKEVAKKLLDNIFKVPETSWVMTSPMLCHGYSGILQTILRSGDSQLILNKSDIIINKILNFIDMDEKFCFINKDVHVDYDIPGFLMGSSGIILTLLSIISESPPQWDQILLLS